MGMLRGASISCLAGMAILGCMGSSEVALQDSTPAAASLRVRQEAGAVLASREEAQAHLNAARDFFLADDEAFAAAELRAAADISRRHAGSAGDPVALGLVQSAGELDALAARVADDALSTVTEMDTAFARLHVAEALHHGARARNAWRDRQPGRAAAEMLMLADHFERAARDLDEPLPPGARNDVATIRSIASMLAQSGLLRSFQTEIALSAVEADLLSLRTRVGSARE